MTTTSLAPVELVCTKCHQAKPADAFHADPKTKTGRRQSCKTCRCAYEAARRPLKREAIAAYNRAYNKTHSAQTVARVKAWVAANRERANAYAREYVARHPERIAAMKRKWSQANPEKRRAHSIFWNAFSAGRIVKPDACESCHVVGYIEAHHHDYSKPLDVKWLCESCHGQADKARRQEAA